MFIIETVFVFCSDELNNSPVEESSLQEPLCSTDLPPSDFDVIKSVEEFCVDDHVEELSDVSSIEEPVKFDSEVFIYFI